MNKLKECKRCLAWVEELPHNIKECDLIMQYDAYEILSSEDIILNIERDNMC